MRRRRTRSGRRSSSRTRCRPSQDCADNTNCCRVIGVRKRDTEKPRILAARFTVPTIPTIRCPENYTAETNRCSIRCISKRNRCKAKSPGELTYPITSTVCRSQNYAFAVIGRPDDNTVVCISEGNSPEISCCTACLGHPTAPAVRRSGDRAIFTDSSPRICVGKGNCHKEIGLLHSTRLNSPGAPAVCRSNNERAIQRFRALSYRCSVICIRKRDSPVFGEFMAMLNYPGVACVCRSQDRTTARVTVIRVRKVHSQEP